MFQKVTIIGYLGRDPEMRYVNGDRAVTNLSVATNRQYTNNAGEKVKETTWFRVSAWGKLAEITNQYLRKGSQVLVEGTLIADENGNPRTYTRNDGGTGASFELRADTVRFLDRKDDNGGNAQKDPGEPSFQNESPAPVGAPDSYEIPF